MERLVEVVEWPDEVRSMWRTQGDLQNLLVRTPLDWPPLYGLIIWTWERVVGPALEASRFLSLLFSLLGIAFAYRAALAVFPPGAKSWPRAQISALLAMSVYA